MKHLLCLALVALASPAYADVTLKCEGTFANTYAAPAPITYTFTVKDDGSIARLNPVGTWSVATRTEQDATHFSGVINGGAFIIDRVSGMLRQSGVIAACTKQADVSPATKF